jgi:hypothetical protein
MHLNERYLEDNRMSFVAVVDNRMSFVAVVDNRMSFVEVVDMEVEDKLMLVGKVGEDRQLEVEQSTEMVDTLLN